jgi:hypothetical protein
MYFFVLVFRKNDLCVLVIWVLLVTYQGNNGWAEQGYFIVVPIYPTVVGLLCSVIIILSAINQKRITVYRWK